MKKTGLRSLRAGHFYLTGNLYTLPEHHHRLQAHRSIFPVFQQPHHQPLHMFSESWLLQLNQLDNLLQVLFLPLQNVQAR